MPKGFVPPDDPKCGATENSYLILKYAHDTAESLLDTFVQVRTARRAKGTPRDEEQDLLRAMVVFAGAGIDSMTKQLVQDALPEMVERLPEIRKRIERLGLRHLRRSGGDSEGDDTAPRTISSKLLIKLLLAESTRAGMVELLVEDLTAKSLQSVDQLYNVVEYLGLSPSSLGVMKDDLQEVFHRRNQVIHEMDIDFKQKNRNRYPRRKEDMISLTRTLLEASNNILNSVAKQLTD